LEKLFWTAALGAIRTVEVPGIHRVEVQKARFIVGSHPRFIKLFLPVSIEFQQREGYVFEDPTIGITKSRLLPQDEPEVHFACEWRAKGHPGTATLRLRPLGFADQELTPQVFQRALEDELRGREIWDSLSDTIKKRLEALCQIQSRLQELVFLARKLALNSRGMFSEPAAHLLIRPGPFKGMGVPMVVFGPRGQDVSLEFLLTLP
jgi:hypothetical protein